MSLKAEIKKDQVYVSAKKSLDNLKNSIEPKEILNELFAMQASRGVSALSPKKILQSSLHVMLNASTQEIAVRSRATTIKMQALRALLSLDQIIDPLRKYILVNYRQQMKDEGSTNITAQRMVCDDILKMFIREKLELDTIVQIADMVISDIDAAGWSLKRISDTLEQSARDR